MRKTGVPHQGGHSSNGGTATGKVLSWVNGDQVASIGPNGVQLIWTALAWDAVAAPQWHPRRVCLLQIDLELG